MWQTVAAETLTVVGPLLPARLGEWLGRRLAAHAAAFAAAGRLTAGPEPDGAALLRAVRDELWPWQWRRKNFLAQVILDVPPAVARRVPLTDDGKRRLSDLAATAV
jgi:hypothetical protein